MPALYPARRANDAGDVDDVDEIGFAVASPRHVDLARSLMQAIRKGQPAVGEFLPTEAELCAQWEMSRYAVRQAVQKLCELGLVTRQSGVGTRVVCDRPPTRYVQSMDTLSDLVHYAQGTRLVTRAARRIQADAELAGTLRCAPGAKWLHIAGVRHTGGGRNPEPIALVDIYVEAAFSKLSGLSRTLEVPVYRMIEEQYNIKVTRVKQELQGVLIEGTAADALQVESGSAGLRITRTYYLRDKVIEVTTGVHPAHRFSYSMTFELSASGA